MMDTKKYVTKYTKGTMTDLKIHGFGLSPDPGKTQDDVDKTLTMGSTRSWSLARVLGLILFTLPHFGCALSIFLILLTLSYNGIIDPCSMKFTYYRHCQQDVYIHENIFSYTDYKEDFFCIMPGVFYHAEEKGWNLDVEC